MSIFIGLVVLLFGSSVLPFADEAEHEYAPIIERKLDFFDFSWKSVEGIPFNLRDHAAGKKLVLINFSAGWCKNSIMNGPVVKRLHDKYKDRGLAVVAVMEYSTPEEINIHINRIGIDYPVVIESESRDDREKTLHFTYRAAAGDKRKWGTPFYVLIDGRDLNNSGAGPISSRVYTVSGELIEQEAERFINARLETGNPR